MSLNLEPILQALSLIHILGESGRTIVAVAAGLVVAVSAGNDYSHHTIGSPGVARQAITVAASDRDDHITDFSSRGPIMGHYDILKPDVAAPGANILSTASSEGYLSDPSGYIRLFGTCLLYTSRCV